MNGIALGNLLLDGVIDPHGRRGVHHQRPLDLWAPLPEIVQHLAGDGMVSLGKGADVVIAPGPVVELPVDVRPPGISGYGSEDRPTRREFHLFAEKLDLGNDPVLGDLRGEVIRGPSQPGIDQYVIGDGIPIRIRIQRPVMGSKGRAPPVAGGIHHDILVVRGVHAVDDIPLDVILMDLVLGGGPLDRDPDLVQGEIVVGDGVEP